MHLGFDSILPNTGKGSVKKNYWEENLGAIFGPAQGPKMSLAYLLPPARLVSCETLGWAHMAPGGGGGESEPEEEEEDGWRGGGGGGADVGQTTGSWEHVASASVGREPEKTYGGQQRGWRNIAGVICL